ncbi:MAG: xanthine dehydrogenase molybdenum-binding subunit XdhA [Firmicutes bacterium]|nr:xanthine dehydrogenase molybdenum-binding subunit XdhA [Bacillota bacterium]
MNVVGTSPRRVDAVDKVTGAAKYTADLYPRDVLCAKIVRSTIAHGIVKSVDITMAMAVPGVVKIFTCFDAPEWTFPTAGHPWSTDPAHQDVADRHVLERHVRFYGDDVAAVVAENDVAAEQVARLVQITYEELPFVLDVQEAMKDGAPRLHEKYPNNILGHAHGTKGDLAEAIKEPGLLCVDKWYDTPIAQHCHLENHCAVAYMEAGKIVVIASTQIPHIVRRCVGQALGIPWGNVRIIKPTLGGGFGNKQDALYEPLCAWLCMQLGGRAVKIDVAREETFTCQRVRHAIRYHLTTWFRQDGTFVGRKMEAYSKQGAYASHGHSIALKGCSAFSQLYKCEAYEYDAYTVFTNTPAAGAMRAYGIPQVSFAMESQVDDIAKILNMDPIELRRKNVMDVGFTDGFSHNVNWTDSHEQCIQEGLKYVDWTNKRAAYAKQTGNIRRGVGMSIFWYNTAVWPISLEVSASRMIMNQDGTIQLFISETEIGQGADTVFAQMAAESVGLRFEDVHVVSAQDTDVYPFGTGAYGSRQTYVAGMSLSQTGGILKQKILAYAAEFLKRPIEELDIRDSQIVGRAAHGAPLPSAAHGAPLPSGAPTAPLISVAELATEALYSTTHSEQFFAESLAQCKSNAYSFGCCFAEVEVDMALCKARVAHILNVHDCGRLINPKLALAQVHGGMSMSIGYGLGEQLLFDEKTGKPLNGNLLDYKLSTALDHPDLLGRFVENPEPTSPFGTKALGEPPAVPCAPAIRNAILNATGVALDAAPMTPHLLFQRFREEGLL